MLIPSEPWPSVEDVVDEEFLAALRRVLRRRAPSAEDADDALQSALLKLLRRRGSLAPATVQAWLLTVARREVADRWRARAQQHALPLDAPGESRDADAGAVAYLAQCMEPLLSQLAEMDRELLRRVDIAGDSQASVARELGLSHSTIKSRVQRARGRLRALLEACCAVEQDRRGMPVDYARRAGGACPCRQTDRSDAM